MLNWFKKREAEKPSDMLEDVSSARRLKLGLVKTRLSLTEKLSALLSGKKAVHEDTLDEIETLLIQADVGVSVTKRFLQSLTQKASRKQQSDGEAVWEFLKNEMITLLKPAEKPLLITEEHKPFVILMAGVNGAGKTTTIGKLAKRLQQENKKVMLAAGDTFRAAAVEQLQVWGERNQIAVVSQGSGADSASVIYDALSSAKAKGADVLIVDTAGRLHTQNNLMEELKKIIRVIKKSDNTAPHEILLILDACIGQNGLVQAKQFHEAIGVTGIVMTKLDGTAKGGILFSIAQELNVPIRFIGVGEKIEDLQPFSATDFVDALMEE